MSSSFWPNAYSLRPTRRYYTRGVAAMLDELREDEELPRKPLLRASVSRPWTAARLRLSALGEEGAVEEEDVQADDQRYDHRGHRGGQTVVDQNPHDVTVAREDQQRNQGEGDAEGEHYLADDQRAARVDPYGEDRQGGKHRDEAPQEQRYTAVYEPLHHHLPSHRPD